MECNKDEAIRAKEIAERKMQGNDFEGARKIALKAKNLYPELENITQLLSICDVHCSAQERLLGVGSEKDWYGILQVEKFADESTVKKQYRRLALILHPDKNRFPGAEGAFKLICEANALLSDREKKSVYDSKVRVSISCAQHQATRATASVDQGEFWTSCPFCKVRYKYLRGHINKILNCPTCRKQFMAYEVTGQGVSRVPKPVQPGARHVPSKPDSRQTTAFQEKVNPNQGSSNMGVRNEKKSSASDAGLEEIANKKSVQSEPGIRTGSGSKGIKVESTAEVVGDSKTKETETHNANSTQGGKAGGISNGDANRKETINLRNKSRKRSTKQSVESSESSDDIENMTMKGNFSDSATALKSESSRAHFMRRSSRKRQHVSYNESDADDLNSPLKRAKATKENNEKEQPVFVNGEESKQNYKGGSPTNADHSKSDTKGKGCGERMQDKDAYRDKKGKVIEESGNKSNASAETIEVESDSDTASSDHTDVLLNCPDPEFSDFEKERHENRFQIDQVWACYDTLDGMPRFYAKVKSVRVSPFELNITWFEAVPIDKSYKNWVDEDLPVGCGNFKLGTTEKTPLRLSFSHQVHCEKGKKKGLFVIYPRKGEVWALFKDWDASWSSNPEDHQVFKYEIVEVLSDFIAGTGLKVCYLDKVDGFVSLFQRASQSTISSFLIGPKELYKFSHLVPSFQLTGNERVGVPIGSFELDPASLPLNPDDLYYPGKEMMACGYIDPGARFSPNNSSKKKGRSVVSEDTSTPRKFVDLEGTHGEVSQPRKSPRGQSNGRQKGNLK